MVLFAFSFLHAECGIDRDMSGKYTLGENRQLIWILYPNCTGEYYHFGAANRKIKPDIFKWKIKRPKKRVINGKIQDDIFQITWIKKYVCRKPGFTVRDGEWIKGKLYEDDCFENEDERNKRQSIKTGVYHNGRVWFGMPIPIGLVQHKLNK